MTKKPSPPDETHKDVLIKTREQFKEELAKRIELGQELQDRKILNPSDLAKSKEDFSSWNDYNGELLKQSFDRPNNDYRRDYCHLGIRFGTMDYQPPPFHELLNDHKTDINEKLNRLKKIKGKIDLIETRIAQLIPIIAKQEKNNSQIAVEKLENLFKKFHRIAQTLRARHGNRPTLIVTDEYDVQDLLKALLKEHFDDIRPEDYVPSHAGSNSRIDFALKNEKIVIETKMTNENLKDKELGNELLTDIGRYKNHPDCNILILFIYDKGDFIINKPGLIKDLNNSSTNELIIKTYINPE